MSTAKELRQAFADKYVTIIGRNVYNQSLRDYVYKTYGGKYYSDCSSSGCATFNVIGVTTSNLNTAGMYYSSLFEKVAITIADGHIPASEFSKLRQGDALMYVGSDPSRPLQIGHVEYIYKLGTDESTTTLCGHGSDTPSYKIMSSYNTTRQVSKASNGKAKGLICVLRRIKDDGSENVTYSDTFAVTTGGQGLKIVGTTSLSIRNKAKNGDVVGAYKESEVVFPTQKIFADGAAWFLTDKGWISGKYVDGWVQELTDASQRWWYVKDGYTYKQSEWFEYNNEWYYFDKDGYMTTHSYVKSVDKDLYYWLNSNGIYSSIWDTETPDLKKYTLMI